MLPTTSQEKGGSRLITTLLKPALQLWLRSQVSAVASLTIDLVARDRQLLKGCLPQVAIAAQGAVYQGLHLSEIALLANNIQVNLGQVLRGQPFRLLATVRSQARLVLTAADLAQSLSAPLLAEAIADILRPLQQAASNALPGDSNHQGKLDQAQVSLRSGGLEISGFLAGQPVCLQTGLVLASPHELCLQQPTWLDAQGQAEQVLPDRLIDLGPETIISELLITPDRLVCQGSIAIVPDDPVAV